MKTVKILAIIFAAVAAVCVIPYKIFVGENGEFEYRSILLGVKRTDGFMDIAVPGSDIDD